MWLVEVVLHDDAQDLGDRMVLEEGLIWSVSVAFGFIYLTNPVKLSWWSAVDDVHELHGQVVLLLVVVVLLQDLEVVHVADGRHERWIAILLVVIMSLMDLHEVIQEQVFAKMVKRNDKRKPLVLDDS